MKVGQNIYQYHFKAWLEDVYYNVPLDPGIVLKLLKDMALHQRVSVSDGVEPGPLVVHCGAGVGRTGVFIVIDILLHLIDYQGKYEHVCVSAREAFSVVVHINISSHR